MNRKQFLAGVGGAALGVGLLDMIKVAKAEMPDPTQDQLLTLAAFVDTVIPTSKPLPPDPNVPNPVTLYDSQFPPQNPVGILPDAGAYETQTKGAVDFPNSYLFLYYVLPQAAHRPTIIDELAFALNTATNQALVDENGDPLTDPNGDPLKFWMLDYYTRYAIVYSMNTLVYSTPTPTQQDFEVKRLLTVAIYGTYLISYSELVNLYPSGVAKGMPYYERNADNSWNIIPDSMWNQMGYPGPTYKNPSYASEYDGLRVTIADGKVKFQDDKVTLKNKASMKLAGKRKSKRKR